VLNTTTGTVESTNEIVWDAGEILTTASNAPVSVTLADPYVRPADRNIITMATVSGATTGVLFNVANKNSFDSAVLCGPQLQPDQHRHRQPRRPAHQLAARRPQRRDFERSEAPCAGAAASWAT
jgi:hypothetical protein